MKTINISSFSKEAASKTKGEILRTLIEESLNSGYEITVDFSTINRFASPFFNNSFASLALSRGFDTVENIKLTNITETGRHTYETSLENAKLIYQSPAFVNEIDKIINNTPKKAE